MLKSLSKLFISGALLCATIFALNVQGQNAKSSRASTGPLTGHSEILCMPGLVFRCNKFGCFCLPR